MHYPKTNRLQATLIGLVLAISASSSAFALDNGAGGTGKSKSDLEKDGYSCEYVATNFWECTKNGETTYWCDSTGQCQPAPRQVPQWPGMVLTPVAAPILNMR